MPQDEKAAFQASLVNFRLLADSTVRVTFDVEPMSAPAFLQAFNQRGDPAFVVRANTIQKSGESEPDVQSNPRIESAGVEEQPRNPERVDPSEKTSHVERGPYSKESRLLHQSSFFYSLAVWRAVGTDEEYQAWCRDKPCAVCMLAGQKSEVPVQYAHVRRAANSGTGLKPAYSGHPCCSEHHRMQHQHGELYVYQSVYKTGYGGTTLNLEAAKQWYEKLAVGYVYRWCRDTLKEQLGYEHWYDVPPSTLLVWSQSNGVEKHLPTVYRDV